MKFLQIVKFSIRFPENFKRHDDRIKPCIKFIFGHETGSGGGFSSLQN